VTYHNAKRFSLPGADFSRGEPPGRNCAPRRRAKNAWRYPARLLPRKWPPLLDRVKVTGANGQSQFD
jgi:hypothetical protein